MNESVTRDGKNTPKTVSSPARIYVLFPGGRVSPGHLPAHQHDEEADERRGPDAGAAEVKHPLAPGLPLLPGPLPPDELPVPPGRVLLRGGAAPPSRGRHGGGHRGQAVRAADPGAVAVLRAQADLADVAEALVARDGGVEREAAGAEHGAEPHDDVAGDPAAVDGDGSAAGGVEGAAGGGVDEDPAQREAGGRDRARRSEALLHERVDAERGAPEPGGAGGVGLHHARHHAGAAVAQVNGRDEARGEGGDGGSRLRRGREREGVGEERPVLPSGCGGGAAAEGGPRGEAQPAPGRRVGGERAEGGARAPQRGQRRAVQPAEHQRQHVRREVLDGRR
jgi:hypothetical protein